MHLPFLPEKAPVVYFNQHLDAAHSKHWSKYTTSPRNLNFYQKSMPPNAPPLAQEKTLFKLKSSYLNCSSVIPGLPGCPGNPLGPSLPPNPFSPLPPG